MSLFSWAGLSRNRRVRRQAEEQRKREKRNVVRRQMLVERLDERAVLSALVGNPGEIVDTNVAAEQLALALVGQKDPGVTISNATFTGDAVQKGSFTFKDSTVVGFGNGIILSSGNAADVVGPNTADWTSSTFPPANSTDPWGPGDPALDALSGFPTYDAAVLEFDFVPTANQVVFNYAFSSDEYPEWVNTGFNDVFAFYVNGTNYATVRQVAGDPNSPQVPVAVNNINNGNPDYYPDFVPQRPDLFRPNYYNPNGPSLIDLEQDGITTVLTFQAPVTPNVVNHMRLAIADASDGIYDSAVFIQAGSLVSNKNPVADLSLLPETGQAPLTVTAFVEGEDPDGLPLTYTIDWGDGTSSGGPLGSPSDPPGENEKTTTANHTYTSSGKKIVTLTVLNSIGLFSTSTEDVNVLGTSNVALDTFILTMPSNPSDDLTPSFTFGSNQAGSTFEYSLDNGATFSPVLGSSLTLPTLAVDTTYTIQVRAVNGGVPDETPATYEWKIVAAGSIAPETVIESMPADPSNNLHPTFTFSSPDPEAEFEFILDLPDPLKDITDWEGSGAVLVLTDKVPVELIDGTYTIQVQALDESGIPDPTPAIYTWTIDTVAPVTTITAFPAHYDNTPAFEFAAGGENVIFTYSIDDGAFVPGKSGIPLPKLSDGPHTFAVKATDAAGNVGLPTDKYGWVIDTTKPAAPVVTLTDDTGKWDNDLITKVGTLNVATESKATVEYSIGDSTVWSDTFTAVEGLNMVKVRQTDAAGNVSDITEFSFTLDTAAPAAPVVALANDTGSSVSDGITQDGALSVTSEAGNVEFSIDGGTTWGAFVPTEGSNAVLAHETDLAGNVSSNASLNFTLDTTPPTLNPTFSPPPPFVVGTQGITVSPNASDAYGIASESAGAVDTSTVGQKSLSCSATDKAGNSTSVSVPYSVIAAPTTEYHIISSQPPIVISKHMTKIPLLFQLTDANNRVVSDPIAKSLLSGITITLDGNPMGKVHYHKRIDTFASTLNVNKLSKGMHQLVISLNVNGTEVASLPFSVEV